MDFEFDVSQSSGKSEELRRLAEAKALRKQTEEDAQLLANRIALLRQEQSKAEKKIEETQLKAKNILNSRIEGLQKH